MTLYHAIITISHRRIAFEYVQPDGANTLTAMPGGRWPVPMAFYVRTDRIALGADALNAAHTHTPGAFEGYFENLTSGLTYVSGGVRHDFRYLIIDAAEQVLERFLHEKLYEPGHIADHRAEMPLTIVCEADVEPNERALIKALFKEAGYTKVRVVEYEPFIRDFVLGNLKERYAYSHTLVGWSEGRDLYLSLVSPDSPGETLTTCLPGLGADPMEKVVSDVVWQRFQGQNSWLTKDEADAAIKSIASDFLKSSEPIVYGAVTLRDGITYHYDLNRTVIETSNPEELRLLRQGVTDFLTRCGITDRGKTLLILRGTLANSRFFNRAFSLGFGVTLHTSPTLRDEVIKRIISSTEKAAATPEVPPVEKPVTPPPPDKEEEQKSRRNWLQLKAELRAHIKNGRCKLAFDLASEFLTQCDESGVYEVSKLVKDFISKNSLDSKSENLQPRQDVEKFRRQLKAAIAVAEGALRSGNRTKAVKNIDEYMASLPDDSSLSEIRQETESYRKKLLTASPEETEKYRSKWRRLKPELRASVSNARYAEAYARAKTFRKEVESLGIVEVVEEVDKFIAKHSLAEKLAESSATDRRSAHSAGSPSSARSATSNEDEGRRLIKSGRLNDAVRWYRQNGNTRKAEMLRKIVKYEGFIQLYRVTLEASRQGKSQSDIARRVADISEFIDLCEAVGIDTTDSRKLLNEYQRIKTSKR